jgi:hypothetical protein
MQVATTSTIEDFRSGFVMGTVPFFGILNDDQTETRIEVSRNLEGEEVIDFRTQGERLLVYIKRPEENALVRIFEPSQNVDLFLFWEVIHGFYKEVPEISEYFWNRLGSGPEEVLQELEKQTDKVIFSIATNLEPFVQDEDLEAH